MARMSSKRRKQRFGKVLVTVITFTSILAILTSCGSNYKEKEDKHEMATVATEKKGVTGVEVADNNKKNVEVFEYSLDGDKIKLESYIGDDEILEVRRKYKVDGKTYKTDISDFQIGIGNNTLKTIIFKEGFKKVKTSVFNSCDVQNVFFPKSMKKVYDYTLSYLNPEDGKKIKIYYAGTQKDWEKIFTKYERTKFSDAEGAEEKGESLADKLNEMIGDGYDSAQFEYFFSASPDDLK